MKVVLRRKYGCKVWCARVLGLGGQYGVIRQFLDGARSDSRSGETGTHTYTIDSPGVYESYEPPSGGRRVSSDWWVALARPDGSLMRIDVTTSLGRSLARRVEAGDSLGWAVIDLALLHQCPDDAADLVAKVEAATGTERLDAAVVLADWLDDHDAADLAAKIRAAAHTARTAAAAA